MAPRWLEEALGQAEEETVPGKMATSSSSSSWERPLTDSQAVEVSDYLLNEQEAHEYFSDEAEEAEYYEPGPSWEHIWFHDHASHGYPLNLAPYGPEAYGAYWERWLAEVIAPPPADYYHQHSAAALARYERRGRHAMPP